VYAPRLLERATRAAKIDMANVDAFAATSGPGLASSLMIGASIAKVWRLVLATVFGDQSSRRPSALAVFQWRFSNQAEHLADCQRRTYDLDPSGGWAIIDWLAAPSTMLRVKRSTKSRRCSGSLSRRSRD